MSQAVCDQNYNFLIVCALTVEEVATKAMLDETYELRKSNNIRQTFGNIGNINVIVACPERRKSSAAAVATELTRVFPLYLCLMVGIGGGVPSQEPNLRLGDVAVATIGYGSFGMVGARP